MSEDRKCPLCGSEPTKWAGTAFKNQECANPKCSLACYHWNAVKRLRTACQFAHGAIIDAIGRADGLDASDGEAAIEMLEEAVPGLRALRFSGGPAI